jgi:hypothetical protein
LPIPCRYLDTIVLAKTAKAFLPNKRNKTVQASIQKSTLTKPKTLKPVHQRFCEVFIGFWVHVKIRRMLFFF